MPSRAPRSPLWSQDPLANAERIPLGSDWVPRSAQLTPRTGIVYRLVIQRFLDGRPMPRHRRSTLYVASPLGFSELGRIAYRQLLEVLSKSGYRIVNPWARLPNNSLAKIQRMRSEPKRGAAYNALILSIGERNARGIEQADGLVAVLDGPDVDSGTASEVGYAAAIGKPILGYRGDFRQASDIPQSTVNVQVEYFVRRHRGLIVPTLRDLRTALRELFP